MARKQEKARLWERTAAVATLWSLSGLRPTRTRKGRKAKARPMPSEALVMTTHAGTTMATTIGSSTTMTTKEEKKKEKKEDMEKKRKKKKQERKFHVYQLGKWT
ncbi:uncharacterized protein LOC109707840 [Ananas comosus]|uniref:Uncharacterized protein LOC109707840 n=1 Tax=Ananas comosus TaxID=4615 RepID=A0A6P5EMU9_ANACO|nr:uncharacterized protein LOC109707840 [Ananas comosus]